jgi:phosphatidylglycerol---prolipoprotein diacylglyceryl transferase
VGVITIGIDPYIDIGPLRLAWHGVTIAIGILLGGLVAARYARERRLDVDPLYTLAVLLIVGGLVGGKLFYAVEHGDPGSLASTRGFTFNGGLILAAVLIAVHVRRTRLDRAYLDVVAVGLPLGVAVGRIGDVINGEHFGPPTDFFLAVRNTHPDASVPSPDVAYHSGGLYEMLIALAVFALVWGLRHRLTRTTLLTWLVLAAVAVGRFFEFFVRSDGTGELLGLVGAQWTSVVMLAVAALGAWLTTRRARQSPS